MPVVSDLIIPLVGVGAVGCATNYLVLAIYKKGFMHRLTQVLIGTVAIKVILEFLAKNV